MNMVIKCLLAALWLLAVPWAAGGTVFYKSKKKSMGMYLLAGYLLMFSVAELMILPMMWANFRCIFWNTVLRELWLWQLWQDLFLCAEKNVCPETVKKNTWKHRYISGLRQC